MTTLDTQPVKILLSDWQVTNGNIFTYLIDTLQVPYLAGADADMMDFLLTSMFGQRTVRISFETKTAEYMAGFLSKLYGNRWQNDFDTFNKFLALEGDAVATGSNSTNQLGKVAGFNSEALVTNNGSDVTGTNQTINTTQQGLLAKDRAVQERKFYEKVCEDIARFITLPIY